MRGLKSSNAGIWAPYLGFDAALRDKFGYVNLKKMMRPNLFCTVSPFSDFKLT